MQAEEFQNDYKFPLNIAACELLFWLQGLSPNTEDWKIGSQNDCVCIEQDLLRGLHPGWK